MDGAGPLLCNSAYVLLKKILKLSERPDIAPFAEAVSRLLQQIQSASPRSAAFVGIRRLHRILKINNRILFAMQNQHLAWIWRNGGKRIYLLHTGGIVPPKLHGTAWDHIRDVVRVAARAKRYFSLSRKNA